MCRATFTYITDASARYAAQFVYTGNNAFSGIGFAKPRGSTLTRHTIVKNGDTLCTFDVGGSDGVGYQWAGSLLLNVDGVPGVGSMPGRWQFYTTPSGSTTASERLRIDSNGNITVGGFANVALF